MNEKQYFHWNGELLGEWNSGDALRRGFCPECGDYVAREGDEAFANLLEDKMCRSCVHQWRLENEPEYLQWWLAKRSEEDV